MVKRHLLTPPRSLPPEPASVLRVMDRLGSFQFDPLEVAGRNHDLLLLARIAGYRRAWTDAHLYETRDLYETYNKGLSLVPTAELPWYRVTWDANRREHEGGAFDEHAPLVEELLDRIRREGQLSSTDIEPRAAIEWYWRPTNPVRAMLEALAEAGILGIARREGNRRIYDLVERLFPAELLAQTHPPDEQLRHKLLSRFRANGLLGNGGEAIVWLGLGPAADRSRRRGDLLEAGAIVPVEVESVRGPRYVVATDLEELAEAEREVEDGGPPGGVAPGVTFLAPLDPLVWDRDLLRQLWGFDYVWEVYVPAKKRRWGYYVLPLLYGDRLVGRIEPRLDRATGTLRILGMWWEEGFDPMEDPAFRPAFVEAIRAHRDFGGLRRVAWPRAVRHRPFVASVRDAV
jgi:uncharacterized protein